MGLSIGMSRCTVYPPAPAVRRKRGVIPIPPPPNPDPARWRLLRKHQYPHAYVLVVRYLDCTNFEGLKVMVYLGRYTKRPERLDPHFAKTDDSPIARFKPDAQGIALAKALAGSLRPGK